MSQSRDLNRFVKLAFCRADFLLELDEDRGVVFAAGASGPLLGRPAETLIGKSFLDVIAKHDRTLVGQMLDAAGEHGRIEDATLRLNGPGESAPTAIVAGYRASDFDGHFFLAVKASSERIAAISDEPVVEDKETGLADEESFSRLAAERVGTFQKAGGRPQITLVKVHDFPGLLKEVGASKKQEVMGAVASILKRESLGGDAAGRVDGESFGFAHSEETDVEGVFDEILGVVGDAVDGEVKSTRDTLDADGAGLTEEQVAKAVIHTVKKFCADGTTGNKVSISQAFNAMMADTVETVALIRKVAQNTELDMVFMPICDLRLGKVHHFEMLTRFTHPKYQGSPFQLISLAEDVEIVHELDMAIIRKAIELIRFYDNREKLPPVAVNLSGQSMNNAQFMEALRMQLRAAELPPGKLMFEITESARVENLEQVNGHMQALRQEGFKFALDDFGAGSASFDYLNMLDADYVKFDGPVVRRACATTKGNDMLSTMAKMCSNQNIQTVAEMIEDKKMANQVYYCGIDYGQGWHFGKPVPDPLEFAEKFVGRDD